MTPDTKPNGFVRVTNWFPHPAFSLTMAAVLFAMALLSSWTFSEANGNQSDVPNREIWGNMVLMTILGLFQFGIGIRSISMREQEPSVPFDGRVQVRKGDRFQLYLMVILFCAMAGVGWRAGWIERTLHLFK